LKKSPGSTLCTLVHVTHVNPDFEVNITNNSPGSDYTVTPVARSYDKNDWENVPGRLMRKFKVKKCNAKRCITRVKQAGKYFLMSSNHKLESFDEKLSRFFMQTTFGPTRDTIGNWEHEDNLRGMAHWVKNQMSLSPTKHREYLRKHAEIMTVNNTIGDTAVSVQHPCEAYSRWRKYAFISSDSQRDFDVVQNGNQFMILVDGKPRTIVDSFSNNEGTISGAGSYTFCTYLFASIFQTIPPFLYLTLCAYTLQY
jgi:hypothetical protein